MTLIEILEHIQYMMKKESLLKRNIPDHLAKMGVEPSLHSEIMISFEENGDYRRRNM